MSNFSFNSGETFTCAFTAANRAPLDFRSECANTARLLADEAKALNRVSTIFLSGGMDSEVVCMAFIEAQVPFKAITFRYPNGLNEHETAYVDKFVARTGIEHSYFDIDIQKWAFSAEAEELFLESESNHFEFMPHMKLMNHVWCNGGMPVMGNHEVEFCLVDGVWSYVKQEYAVPLFKHLKLYGMQGTVGFLQHTTEQVLAMALHPRMRALCEGKNKLANLLLKSSNEVKYEVYKDCWPEMEVRPKQTGAERVRGLMISRAHEMQKKQGRLFNRKWVVPYNQFIERLNK